MPPRSRESDEELAGAAAAGSRAAFEQLVERYGAAVQRLFEARLGDAHRALDLSQDVWIRVFRGLCSFSPEPDRATFRSWLFAIALNAARDEARRGQRAPLELSAAFDREPETIAPAAESILGAAVDVAIAAVPEPYRTALVLVDREGLEYEEAARSLGCAIGTVKSRVHRGRRTFREHWKQSGVAVASSDTGAKR